MVVFIRTKIKKSRQSQLRGIHYYYTGVVVPNGPSSSNTYIHITKKYWIVTSI